MGFEELLFRAKQGDKMAIEEILNIYHPMLVKNSLVKGRFDEDLYQELVSIMMKCILYFWKPE